MAMTRKQQLARAVHAARGENYAIHYERYFNFISAYPQAAREQLAGAAALLAAFPIPTFTADVPNLDEWMPQETQNLLKSAWPAGSIHLFNPWYFTDEGFEGFRRLYQALPEPEEIDPVDNLWISAEILLRTRGKRVGKTATYPQEFSIQACAAGFSFNPCG